MKISLRLLNSSQTSHLLYVLGKSQKVLWELRLNPKFFRAMKASNNECYLALRISIQASHKISLTKSPLHKNQYKEVSLIYSANLWRKDLMSVLTRQILSWFISLKKVIQKTLREKSHTVIFNEFNSLIWFWK